MGNDNICVFVVTMALFVILRDFQAAIGVKRFVFDITDLSPFIAAIICLLVFKHKRTNGEFKIHF